MADFCKGFAFELDVPLKSMLTIEGRRIEDFKKTSRGFAARLPSGERITASMTARRPIEELVKLYLERTGALKARDDLRRAHLRELGRGAKHWNQWRRDNPGIHPMLACVKAGVHFTRKRLDGYDFSYANLCEAQLQDTQLRGANFHQAILAGANLSRARLRGANFCRTDLYKTKFRDASLRGANLQGVQLAKTDLTGADLRDCTVYGMSAWDLRVKNARQGKLIIRYRPAGPHDGRNMEVRVDGLDPAAFMYFALNNRNISTIMNAAGEKWVLILGRFTNRRSVLKKVAAALERQQFIPVIFDFERPKQRDLIETIVLLAGMSAFVIVELTNPRSVPLELQAIASNFGVPVVPIIKKGSRPFAMFAGLRKFRWVSRPVEYRTANDLIRRLRTRVIRPAMEERRRLATLKRQAEAS